MPKLLKVFNQSYVQVFKILSTSFCDEKQEEDMLLAAEVKRLHSFLEEKDGMSPTVFTKFKTETKDFVNDIFAKNEDLFTQDKLGFLSEIKFSKMWARFVDSEKTVFWKNITSLCRYSSMLQACGDQLASMEDMAVDFMKSKKDTKPEDYHMALFKEMLSGGDMSKKLLDTFKDPNCIKNILGNVSTIMRSADDESGGSSDFTDILKMANMFEDSELEEVQKGIVETLSGDGTTNIENQLAMASLGSLFEDKKQKL